MDTREILKNLDVINIRVGIRNNGGGVYHHQFYWKNMKKPLEGKNRPTGDLYDAIMNYFGSFDKLKSKFTQAAVSRFGSGWAWLVLDDCNWLQVITTANQDSQISANLCPRLTLDVWEHAYYLKCQNLRNQYIENWWNLVNWQEAEKNSKGTSTNNLMKNNFQTADKKNKTCLRSFSCFYFCAMKMSSDAKFLLKCTRL